MIRKAEVVTSAALQVKVAWSVFHASMPLPRSRSYDFGANGCVKCERVAAEVENFGHNSATIAP